MSTHVLIVLLISFFTSTVSGLKCLSCHDLTHPRFCTQLSTCVAGEVCGIEKYISDDGDRRYSLGCVANEVCTGHASNITVRAIHSAGSVRQCLQCCKSDLCNSGGCGETGFQELGRTVCYNCQYQSDQHRCSIVETCAVDEICYIQEIQQYAEKYFHSGCRRKGFCDALYNPGPAIGRRKRDDLCLHCCNGSLCNNICTKGESNIKDKCSDKPECSSLMSHYNVCQDSQTASYMCPKSCGMCNEIATTPLPIPTCVDKSSNCEYLHNRLGICNDSSIVDQLGCHKTCRMCDGQITVPSSSTTLADVSTDTSGTEFYFAFTSNYDSQSFLTMFVVSEGIGYFNVSIPYKSLHDTVDINSKLVIYNISESIMPTPLLIEKKGIHVVSSVPVFLFVLNEQFSGDSSDAFNVLPADQLTKHYLIPSSEPKQKDYTLSQVSVTSTTDRNNVTFTLVGSGHVIYNSKTYMNGDSLSVLLNKMDTFELTHNHDLSGTKITASEPIAVVSGNKCNYFKPYCSHLSDMVPPIDTFDTTFVIPHFPPQYVKILIMAGKNNTSVNVTSGSVITKYLHHAGDSVVMDINSTTAVSSTQGVLVTQFIYGDDFDPSMLILPGIGQYISNYSFVVPFTHYRTPFDNYITLIVRSSAVNGLFIDGKGVGHVQRNSLQIAGVSYDYFKMSITPGYHNMYHDYDVTFGLFVFGKRSVDSYAFAAGKHLVNHMS